MCQVCGCGESAEEHDHHHEQGHAHGHAHDHEHEHGVAHRHRPDGSIDYGAGPAGAHAAGVSQGRLVKIEQDIRAHNNRFAEQNRQLFAAGRILALNLVSSPGSGKTTLLCRTVAELKGALPVAVIEGDQQTSFDADRVRAAGVPAVQVNTGKGCHLDAQMIGHAVQGLGLADGSVLFIENVGNLVCPAGFDLGEAAKVVILSVTEGEDKPLKYPDMFAASELMLLNKTDLLPHVSFDVARCIGYARKVNPKIEVLEISATGGQGMEAWCRWIERRRAAAPAHHHAEVV
jgi:hydrogenase nickel incorporation protein HypB